MAAATLVGKRRESVVGDRRMVTAQVTLANNGDTYNTGLKTITGLSIDPTTNASVGATFAGGVLTFAYGGGALTVNVIAYGWA